MAGNHVKTAGIITMALSTFLVAPSTVAVGAALAGSLAVYILAAPTSFWEYGGLAVAVCWFARTKSPKIRAFIFVVFALLFLYGMWGHQLIV